MDEDPLIKEFAGLGGVDQVRAIETHETAHDAHPDKDAVQLPGSFTRGCAEHIPGSVQSPDFLNHPWKRRTHAAGDKRFATAAEMRPCGTICRQRDAHGGAHAAQPGLLVPGPVRPAAGAWVGAETRLVLYEEPARNVSVARGPPFDCAAETRRAAMAS